MQKNCSMKEILLVSDMDRTLITDEFKVPERNILAINRFIDEGGHFTLATGRSASSAVKYLKEVNINAPAILSNGASIYDLKTDKILWNTSLPQNSKSLLYNILEKFPEIGAELYINEQIYIVNMNEWTKRHIINEGFKHSITTIDKAPNNWQKILFACPHDYLVKVDEYLKSVPHDGCDVVFSNEMYYEILPKGVSKGTALKRLGKFIGNIKTIVGIGDYYNDESLIEMADIGVATFGAPMDLKAKAQFVTGCCENGAVADIIEYLENNIELNLKEAK